jgi:hypothetical protein
MFHTRDQVKVLQFAEVGCEAVGPVVDGWKPMTKMTPFKNDGFVELYLRVISAPTSGDEWRKRSI